MDSTMKMKFSGIFTMRFAMSTSKYVSIRNFNKIRGISFLELYPNSSDNLADTIALKFTFTAII